MIICNQQMGDSTAAKAVGIDPDQIKKSGMKIVHKKMEEGHLVSV